MGWGVEGDGLWEEEQTEYEAGEGRVDRCAGTRGHGDKAQGDKV